MSDRLGPHIKHTHRNPCDLCQKDGCVTLLNDGTILCVRRESNHRAPSGIGWLHHPEPDWRERLPAAPLSARAPQIEPDPPDPAICDRGLRAILDRCPLSPAHRDDLRVRGLPDRHIDALPFGSLPDDEDARNRVAAAVVEELGEDAYGNVPGLHHDDGTPQLNAYPGLLIGVEQDGRLVGVVVRPNDADVRKGGKYRHLSSRTKPGGVGSGAQCGVISPFGFDWKPGTPVTRIIIAEGILKGYVVANLTGLPVIAIPGATITADVPRLVATRGATDVVLAFDNDRLTNRNVAVAERGLADRLRAVGLAASRLIWPTDYKGLDDALAAGVMPIIEPIDPPAAETPDDSPCFVQLVNERKRYQELSELHSAVMTALGNKSLNPAERIVAVMTMKHIAAEDRGHPPGEAHPIPTVRIAEDAGVSVSTATTAIKTIEQGLIVPRDDGEADPVRLFTRSVRFTPGVVNQRTGEVRDINQAYYTRSSPSLSSDLRTLAMATKAKPRAHGGTRTVCPDHPNAGVEVTTTRRCAACARVLSTDTRHEAPNAQGANTQDAYLVPSGGDASSQPVFIDVEGPNEQDAYSVSLGDEASEHQPLTAVKGVNTQDAHLVQITLPSENVTSLVNLDVSHNDKQPASVGDAWLAGAPLVDALPIPPPAQDVVLDPVRPALAAADRAHDRTERHRTNGELGARLVDLARSRGRMPVPKPPPEPSARPAPRSYIDGEYEVWAP